MTTEFKNTEVGLDDWIDNGVSFLQAEVTIYRNPAIYAKYQPLMEQIYALEQELKPPKKDKKERSLEESVGGIPEAQEEALGEGIRAGLSQRLEELYAEAQVIYDEYVKDIEVWTLRRLDEHEVQEEREALGPVPEAPAKPPVNAKAAAQTAHKRKMEAWIVEIREYTDQLNKRCLARATMKVVVKGEEKPAPSYEGIQRLEKRPGGKRHLEELIKALESLTVEGVEIMAPHREGAGA